MDESASGRAPLAARYARQAAAPFTGAGICRARRGKALPSGQQPQPQPLPFPKPLPPQQDRSSRIQIREQQSFPSPPKILPKPFPQPLLPPQQDRRSRIQMMLLHPEPPLHPYIHISYPCQIPPNNHSS